MKHGDLVRFSLPGAKEMHLPSSITGCVVGLAGMDNVIVLTASCDTYQPLLSSCTRVPTTEDTKPIRAAILALSKTAEGKAAIKTARTPATAVYSHPVLNGRLVRVDVPPPVDPGSGPSQRDYRVEPSVLTEGKTSNPTETLLKFCDFWGHRYGDAVDNLSPALQDVLRLTVQEERTDEDAAAILGISHGAVRLRLHYARRALKRAIGTSDDLLAGYSAKADEDVSFGTR